ncbi:MFS transporter, SP family [Aphelenchoides fujianensis]|nr:MFS transporter, SP family [Aphelenchoides fujianensis]
MFTATYYVSVLAATLGASTQFYSYGIVNQEKAVLTQWINATYSARGILLTDTQMSFLWSFIVSSVAIGAIPGALSTRFLSERYGRRNTLVGNGVVNVIAASMEFAAKYVHSPELLLLGRIILGANIGLTSGVVPIYLIEITPSVYRNRVGTLHQVAVAFSEVFSLLLGMEEVQIIASGTERYWPFAFGFPGLLALILVLLLPLCPESPKYLLITRGQKREASDALLRLVDKPTASGMFSALLEEQVASHERVGSYRELFTRRDLRRPLAICLTLMFAQQFSGCSAVFAYSTDMFLNANLSGQHARFATLLVALCYFGAAVLAPFVIDRVGNRRLTAFQLTGVSVSMAALSVFTWRQLRSTEHSHFDFYGTIASVVAYMFVYGVGAPVSWISVGIYFDTKMRPAAATVCVFVAFSLSFVVTTLFLPWQKLVGVEYSYTPFIVASSFFALLLGCTLPEAPSTAAEKAVARRNRNDSYISNVSVL